MQDEMIAQSPAFTFDPEVGTYSVCRKFRPDPSVPYLVPVPFDKQSTREAK
jgi:hypothetical protein